MQKELIRISNELIVTIQDDDENIIASLEKEAKEQAKIHGLNLQMFCNQAVAMTFRGPEEKIQRVYEFYFLN